MILESIYFKNSLLKAITSLYHIFCGIKTEKRYMVKYDIFRDLSPTKGHSPVTP